MLNIAKINFIYFSKNSSRLKTSQYAWTHGSGIYYIQLCYKMMSILHKNEALRVKKESWVALDQPKDQGKVNWISLNQKLKF
jgi:hypothetical protein